MITLDVLGTPAPKIAVGTTLNLSARVAPRTDPDGRHYRIRFLSRMVASYRSSGQG